MSLLPAVVGGERDGLQLPKAQPDQMCREPDDAPAALRSLHLRGELCKMERFPGIRERLDETRADRQGG